MNDYIYILNGSTLTLDREGCINCGICMEVCPHGVLSRPKTEKANAEETPQITDRARCMECGACALNCPAGAISVTRGVGCAYAVINGMLKGTEPDCSCGCGNTGEAGKNRCC